MVDKKDRETRIQINFNTESGILRVLHQRIVIAIDRGRLQALGLDLQIIKIIWTKTDPFEFL